MMGHLRDVRIQLLIVVGVLVLVDLAAIVLLMSPAGRSRGARQMAYEQLRVEKFEKAKAVAPAQDMDQKIVTAREQQVDFTRERMAARYSAMSEQLSHLGSEAGVSVTDVKYDAREEKGLPPGYDSIGITIQVRGSYEQDMRFVNAVERQKMLLLIDAVTFGGMQRDALTVSVHLSTFLRSPA
jgi:Tfp pilus assembly protein PilO